ncbi:hypothetical protein M885DRAFT_505698 [Pelagophyceae sp. CCMP2097]|nr:hypothetical protein M885DRAFT_505698 [Pelagophyceae sp. CCMP2097]
MVRRQWRWSPRSECATGTLLIRLCATQKKVFLASEESARTLTPLQGKKPVGSMLVKTAFALNAFTAAPGKRSLGPSRRALGCPAFIDGATRESNPLNDVACLDVAPTVLPPAILPASAAAVLQKASEACDKHGLFPDEYTFSPPQNNVLPVTRANAAAANAPAAVEKPVNLVATALPLFVIWLSGPLLSLIDTSVVGRCSPPGATVGALAALAPALSVCDTAAYLLSFIAIATTTQVARARADGDVAASHTARRDGVQLSWGLGAVAAALIMGNGRRVLGLYTTPSTASVVPLALGYVAIRIAVLPVQVAWMTTQSASIARGEIANPLRCTAVAAFVNIAMDVLLVAKLRLGIRGAALATAASIFAGFATESFLLRRAEQTELSLLPGGVAEPARTEGGVGRLAKEAAPIALVLLSKSLVGVFLTAAGATGDVVKLAAHQIACSLFWFLCPFGDALANAAQALLPGQLKSKTVSDGQVVKTFLRQTGACAAFSGLLVGLLISAGVANAFTSSAACVNIVSQVALPLTLTLAGYCVATAVEGSMFALGAAGPVAVLMPVNAAAVCAAFYFLRRAAAPLPAVWLTFLAYQLIRWPQLALVARQALLKRSRAYDALAKTAALGNRRE